MATRYLESVRDPMKIPNGLQPLIDDGIIDGVLRPLKSGKEAAVFVVSSGDEVLCAKVYKDMAQRSFQARVQYQEGRKVRGSRQARAMGKATKFGRREQEAAWKTTEADALYQLFDAGVRVPQPRGFFHGVLLMELVTDAHGRSAPRLGEVEHSPSQAREFHRRLIADVVRMLSLGLIHGDLSEYNVLVAEDGPVIIDLPQVVSAAGNNSARAMLLRTTARKCGSCSRRANCVRTARSPAASSSTPVVPTRARCCGRSRTRARRRRSASRAARKPKSATEPRLASPVALRDVAAACAYSSCAFA
jgi:RIO kinase 1